MSARVDERRRTLARGIGLVVLLALAIGLIVARCNITGTATEADLDRGLDALAAALQGERAKFVEAEEAFGRAAGSVLFDGYPLFALELTKAFEEGRATASDAAVRPVVEALARGDFAGAVAKLPTIPEGFVGRAHLERLVVELARRARSTAVR